MALLAVCLLIPLALPVAGRMVEGLSLMIDLADGPGGHAGHWVGPPPVRISLPEGPADLYQPARTGHGIVLLPGLDADSRDDPVLVEFAFTLARAGFTVLVPELSGRRALRIGPGEIGEIAAAVVALSDRLEQRPVGLVAVSYAAGPAVLAALDPAAGARLAFLLMIGGYHDLTAALTYLTTGRFRDHPGAPWQTRQPEGVALWRMVETNLHHIFSLGDRDRLRRMAHRRLRDGDAPIADLAGDLGPEGRAVLALLDNRDPEQVPSLIEALPAGISQALRDLDPSRHDLSRLHCRLILVHGRADPTIPYTEALAWAAAMPPGQVRLHLIGNFRHISFKNINFSDLYSLGSAVLDVLAFRDR